MTRFLVQLMRHHDPCSSMLATQTACFFSTKPTSKFATMAMNSCRFPAKDTSVLPVCSGPQKNKLPVLIFDVMDTLVRDPFYQDVPAFFRMPFRELMKSKHPTAWVEFEMGHINEMELAEKFFRDGRPLDLQGLKECMKSGYSYIEGIEPLLHNLKQNGYEMHAFTNYPIWYTMIEEKLKLSTYLFWTFCSCKTGKRKPATDSYLDVLRHLAVDPASCIFIDDRSLNVEAAANVGMVGIHFKNATALEQDLMMMGVETGGTNHEKARNHDSALPVQEQLL